MTKDNKLSQEIIGLYDRIVDQVAALKEETKQTVEEFKEEQKELREKLKEKLAKGESLRKKDFDLLIKDIIEKRKQRQQDVARMIEQFKTEEEEMASGLRQLLGKGEEVRVKDFKKMLARIRARQEERGPEVEELTKAASYIKEEVANMLEGFKKERRETAAQWQKLAATMQKKRLSKRR
jgi:methyl-accepting chemotaxis protein